MKKIGQYWLPAVDTRWFEPRFKAWRIYGLRGGPKLGDLSEALAYVDRWTIAIDGGANVGAYSRVLMERFERVYAFEPTPETFEALQRNLELWGAEDRVRSYPHALSDRAEAVRMEIPDGRRSLSSRIAGDGPIPAICIDELDLPDLSFLKLDVEGYEFRALSGAVETIRRFKPVIMFEDKDRLSSRYGGAGDAHELLDSLGARLLAVVGPRQFDYVYGF